MAGEDVEVLEEAGLRAEVEPVLLQPLVEGGGGSGYAATAAEKSPRLASLDVFRGLSIAVMILVDNAGGVWPSINHSPWTGITLADFVMPFFSVHSGCSTRPYIQENNQGQKGSIAEGTRPNCETSNCGTCYSRWLFPWTP